jgi:broad specificity phosphatase PhoE
VILFVRHGQTEVNRAGRFQGRHDAALTPLGVAQADALGRALAALPIARVLASPLSRAQRTAAAIAGPHGLAVELDERLVELDYGTWDQRALADVTQQEWSAWRADPGFSPPGGESLLDVRARVAQLLDDLLGDDVVVAVSHVSPIKAAVCVALGVDERATWRMHLDIASITRIGLRGTAPYLASFNETAHLAEVR